MNEVRIAVEWNYKDVKQEFASQDFHRWLQLRKLLLLAYTYQGTSRLVYVVLLSQVHTFLVFLLRKIGSCLVLNRLTILK